MSNCISCAHVREILLPLNKTGMTELILECHRRAPVCDSKSGLALWPRMKQWDECGEYKYDENAPRRVCR